MQSSKYILLLLVAILCFDAQAQWQIYSFGGSSPEKILVSENPKGIWIFDKEGGSFWLPWDDENDEWDAWEDFDANYYWCMGGDFAIIGETETPYALSATMAANHRYQYSSGSWDYYYQPIDNAYYMYHDAQFYGDANNTMDANHFIVSTWQLWDDGSGNYHLGLFLITNGQIPSQTNIIPNTDGIAFSKIYRDIRTGGLNSNDTLYTFYDEGFWRITVTGTGQQVTASVSSDFNEETLECEIEGVLAFYQSKDEVSEYHQYLLLKTRNQSDEVTIDVWHRAAGANGFRDDEWLPIWEDVESGVSIPTSSFTAYYNSTGEYHNIYLCGDKYGVYHYKKPTGAGTLTGPFNSVGSDYLQFYNSRAMALTPWSTQTPSSSFDQLVVGGVHGEVHFTEIELSNPPTLEDIFTLSGYIPEQGAKLSGEPRYVYQDGNTVYYPTWGMGIYKGNFSGASPEFSKIGNAAAMPNKADFNFNWNCCVRSPFDSNELILGAPLKQFWDGDELIDHIGIWSLDESTNELSSENENCFPTGYGPYTVIDLGADYDKDLVYVSCMGTGEFPLDLTYESVLYSWDGADMDEYDGIVYSQPCGYYHDDIPVAGFGLVDAHCEFRPVLPHPNPYFSNTDNPICVVFGIGLQFCDWGDYAGVGGASGVDFWGGGLGYAYKIANNDWVYNQNVQEIIGLDHDGMGDALYFEHPCDMLAEYNSTYYNGFTEYQKMDILVATRAWPPSHGAEDIWRYGGLFDVHYDGDEWVVRNVTPYAGGGLTYKIGTTANFQHPACMSVAKYDLGATNIYYCTTSGEEGGTQDGHLGLIWYQQAATIRNLTIAGWNLYQDGRIPYPDNNAYDRFFTDEYSGLVALEGKLIVGKNMYPAQFELDNITENTTWNGNIDIAGNIIVSNDATLTLGPLCQVQVLGGYSLTVDGGHLKVQYPDSTRIVFDSPDAVRWKGIVFKDISGTAVDTLKNLEVRNAEYGVYIDYDDSDSLRLLIENCLFDGNCIGIGAKSADQLNITNCEIRNSVKEGNFNGDGIYLYNLATTAGITHFVKNCEIHDNEGCGVRITTCGGNVMLYNNAIENNLQQNSGGATAWAGVYCYNSSPKLLFNQVVESLGYPLVTFSSAAPYLCQGPDSTNEFTLDVAEADTHYAVVYADGGFPIMNNTRNNFSHGGTTTGLLIDDATETPTKHYARYNWWGSSTPDNDQFSPLDSTDYSNYLSNPASFPTGLPDRGIYTAQDEVYELLYASLEAYHNGNIADAFVGFIEITTNYPYYQEAVSMAIPYLMTTGLNLPISPDSVYSYLNSLFEYYGDSYVGKTARRIRNICSLKMENYNDAISDYEDIITNPSSFSDSIFALIDINQAYLIMNGSGLPGIQSVSPVNDYNPGTLENYMKRESELLALLNSGTTAGSAELLPASFCLHQNYPNPFNPVTTIQYDLPELSNVKLEIFNVLGQRVMTLVDGLENPGFKKVEWDGNSASSIPISSGVYIYRLQVTGKETGNKFSNSKKMILMK